MTDDESGLCAGGGARAVGKKDVRACALDRDRGRGQAGGGGGGGGGDEDNYNTWPIRILNFPLRQRNTKDVA